MYLCFVFQSLVFGGNFLHSFGILKQLKIAQVEDATKVPQKFRYPFFTEMLWHVLVKYVYTLLGRSHLEGEMNREQEVADKPHAHLTHYELFGLKVCGLRSILIFKNHQKRSFYFFHQIDTGNRHVFV